VRREECKGGERGVDPVPDGVDGEHAICGVDPLPDGAAGEYAIRGVDPLPDGADGEYAIRGADPTSDGVDAGAFNGKLRAADSRTTGITGAEAGGSRGVTVEY